ncbi:MAG: RiPP maturation radical SAM C-methyltransferase, partial [Myxococcota bacterium]
MRPSVTPDIALVNMPYAQLATPSVALGILKTCLTQEGLGASVLNAQLLFAERIGPGLYSFLIRGFPCLVGEWTFSNAAFPEFAPDNDKYVARVARMLAREEPPAVVIEQLWETRAKAEQFVDELAAQILEASPRIVACTSVFQQHCAALALLRRVKELDPAVIALIGGSNCESEMGRTALLNVPWLDVVVSGEADSLFAPLCQDLLAHGPGLPIEKLAEGVFAHQHRTRWSAGEELPVTRHVLNDMRGSPTPDYDDYYSNLETSPLNRAVSPGVPIETSRGCWWGQRKHCTFCGI